MNKKSKTFFFNFSILKIGKKEHSQICLFTKHKNINCLNTLSLVNHLQSLSLSLSPSSIWTWSSNPAFIASTLYHHQSGRWFPHFSQSNPTALFLSPQSEHSQIYLSLFPLFDLNKGIRSLPHISSSTKAKPHEHRRHPRQPPWSVAFWLLSLLFLYYLFSRSLSLFIFPFFSSHLWTKPIVWFFGWITSLVFFRL